MGADRLAVVEEEDRPWREPRLPPPLERVARSDRPTPAPDSPTEKRELKLPRRLGEGVWEHGLHGAPAHLRSDPRRQLVGEVEEDPGPEHLDEGPPHLRAREDKVEGRDRLRRDNRDQAALAAEPRDGPYGRRRSRLVAWISTDIYGFARPRKRRKEDMRDLGLVKEGEEDGNPLVDCRISRK